MLKTEKDAKEKEVDMTDEALYKALMLNIDRNHQRTFSLEYHFVERDVEYFLLYVQIN